MWIYNCSTERWETLGWRKSGQVSLMTVFALMLRLRLSECIHNIEGASRRQHAGQQKRVWSSNSAAQLHTHSLFGSKCSRRSGATSAHNLAPFSWRGRMENVHRRSEDISISLVSFHSYRVQRRTLTLWVRQFLRNRRLIYSTFKS